MSDSKQNNSSFSPLTFLAGLSQLHLGVQRNISWRKPIWNNLFSKTFFSVFEQKVLGLFTKIFWQISKKAFYVSRGTGYEKVWVKKRANKQNLFQELVLTTFGLLVVFFRLFCQNCILPVKQLFDWKQNLLLKHWLVLFMEIGRKLSRFWQNCFRTVVQIAFYMFEGETLVLSNFWGGNFVSEKFCNFQWINGFRAKHYRFLFT